MTLTDCFNSEAYGSFRPVQPQLGFLKPTDFHGCGVAIEVALGSAVLMFL